MTQQHFHGPVDQVAGGNIYNHLNVVPCPRCADHIMTPAQRVCNPCKAKIEANARAAFWSQSLALLAATGIFCYVWLNDLGIDGDALTYGSLIGAGLMTWGLFEVKLTIDGWFRGGNK